MSVEFKVYGERALFTQPYSRSGGELTTYPIPTQEAMRGLISGIYWKPTFDWVIEEIKVLNEIKYESDVIKLVEDNSTKRTLVNYIFLKNVSYAVRAHFVFNKSRADLVSDRRSGKHFAIVSELIKKSVSRFPVFLGKKMCPAFIDPCDFDAEPSFYNGKGTVDFGIMFQKHLYKNLTEDGKEYKGFSPIIMENGVVKFQEKCQFLKRLS